MFECLPHVAKEAKKHLDKGSHRPDIILHLSVFINDFPNARRKVATIFTRADCIQGVIE